MSDYDQRFGGLARLYGVGGAEALRRAHVCVVGVGGVGSWSVEALARSGIGKLTLIDLDDVCVTNTNRQIHALDGEIGRPKVEVMADRVRRINPECEIRAEVDFFTPSSAEALIRAGAFDVVLDAIDQVPNKCLLLARCRDLQIPAVTVGGAGGRRDPARVAVDDLTRTQHDGLLRSVRRTLRADHGFPGGNARWGIPCVYSTEQVVFPGADGQVCDSPEPGVSLRLDCASGFGTASFVTGTFGLVAASIVVNRIAAPA